MESYVRFHDISSGETVKKIKLEQPFEESMVGLRSLFCT